MSWLKKNLKNILLTASVVLNALGGTGLIPPVVGQAVGAAAATLPAGK